MYSRKGSKQIYGPRHSSATSPCSAPSNAPCVLKIPVEKDINTYLHPLELVLTALTTHNNKNAALENITIIENNINTALNS
jgi:hypothetical protein